jgi:hypothetical protein
MSPDLTEVKLPANPTPDELKEEVRKGLKILSESVHAMQVQLGYWPGRDTVGTAVVDPSTFDFRVFFADLHSKVSKAYESYGEQRDPKHLTWIDPENGGEVEPGHGVPQGLAVDLMDIVFDVLGFAENVGINSGAIAADMGIPFEAEAKDDFDLESLIGSLDGDDDDDDQADLDIPDKPTGSVTTQK